MKRTAKKDGKVTVIVPTYNRASFVETCVKSIQEQTYTNLKIVVVDDGSTDNTIEVLEALQSSDKRIEIRKNKVNTGSMNKALNTEILACDTEYVTWIGSDDKYIPSAIGQLVSQHQQNPKVDFVSCDLKMTSKNHDYCNYCGSAWPNWTGYASLNPFKQYDAESYVTLVYKSLCPPFPWNGMWKNDFFVRNDISWIEYKGNTWSPDTLNGLHFFAHGMTMVHYNEFPLIVYRLHESQDTNTGAVSEQIRCDITLIEAIHEWFDPKDFIGKSLNTPQKHLEFLNRLKELTEHHAERFKDSPKIKEALSYIAVKALTYIWNHKVQDTTVMSEYFKKYV
jgi:glycosyltransferase involved in cell wall biosynthesis